MEDSRIIELYFARSEAAIDATQEKYGRYCRSIAQNILQSPEDTEECLNDTWLNAWRAMPPHRPQRLAVFLGRITRNLALGLLQKRRAAKRGGGALPAPLAELGELVGGAESAEDAVQRQELLAAVEAFLRTLREEQRRIFLCRYWYFDPVGEIAARFGKSENQVSVLLHRLRTRLREDLTKRGFSL